MDRRTVSRLFLAATAGVALLVAAPAFAVPASPSWAPPYEVQVVVDGVPVREYPQDGRFFVEGLQGRRYALRLINRTDRRVEVVATVDGLDVVDGKPGDYVRKRGYVLEPWQTYDVEGFRLDMGRVAAFRFSSVGASYAARTGNARNVGVIGVAFFEERRPLPPPRPRPYRTWDDEDRGGDGYLGRYKEEGDARTEAAPADESAQRLQSRGGAGFGGPTASAPAPAMDGLATGRAAGKASTRPGLGTAFGESRHSDVVESSFVRADASHPTRLISVRYDDRAGLLAQGVRIDPPRPDDSYLRATADPFPAAPHPRRFAQPPCGWRE